MNCPCCGQSVKAPTDLDRAITALSPTMKVIVRAIARKPGISSADVADAIYVNARGGGPQDGSGVVRKIIYAQKSRLAAHGWQIVGRATHGGGYTLQRIE